VRALLQRVSEASVAVDGETIAAIDQGLLVLLGIFPHDGRTEIIWLVDKILGLRIFADAASRMNLSITDVAGSVLVISQFTLAADTRKGKRPGFSTAAPPPLAQRLYDEFLSVMRAQWDKVECGRFGADMQVTLINDGPVTFLLENPETARSS
jgi:D-tyrosyl-tRNA(Tyr) deacylase